MLNIGISLQLISNAKSLLIDLRAMNKIPKALGFYGYVNLNTDNEACGMQGNHIIVYRFVTFMCTLFVLTSLINMESKHVEKEPRL